VQAVGEHVNGLSMTNAISAAVSQDGSLLFNGQPRGICGDAIRSASLQQVQMFRTILTEISPEQTTRLTEIMGVGGISAEQHVQDYLDAGATAVGMATAAMLEPMTALHIRRQRAERT
ncbi:MAG: hypothetical protein KDA85_10300, partial [Planctomycetaceae bacterium]|nr:hypothetical protein [Planctomycetaceae bacterium]